MATPITYSEACTRFANLATTGISIGDAIIEAVQRIFEMGRYPGTTVEIELSESDFVEDSNIGCHFLYFAESSYDGAIGFRSDSRGWGIVDHTALYKDGINSGDMEFVDYGTVNYQTGTVSSPDSIVVTGSISPDATETFTDRLDDVNGRQCFTFGNIVMDSEIGAIFSPGDASASGVAVWDGELWKLAWYSAGSVDVGDVITWFSGSDVALPSDASGWTAGAGASGTPLFAFTAGTVEPIIVSSRKYRAPLGFPPNAGPYYCLMKLEAPTLESDTVLPVASIAALKCAILAVCEEWVNDDERAMLNWQKFDQFMTRSERQVHGPKKFRVGMDCSLRRKPSQFS
jgi:hypothetical protein